MEITWEDNLEAIADEIEKLNTPRDRADLYNALGVAASEFVRKQLEVPNKYFTDRSGNLRYRTQIKKGNVRNPSQIIFYTHYGHIVDGGSVNFQGTNWVDRLLMENRDGAGRAAVAAAEPAWRRFAKKIERATAKARLKPS